MLFRSLWDTPRNGGFAIAGPDWLAVQLGSAWDFYDPSDGRWLGYLDALGTFCTDRKGCSDGAGVPFRPEMGRAHPWKPYDGTPRPYVAPPSSSPPRSPPRSRRPPALPTTAPPFPLGSRAWETPCS